MPLGISWDSSNSYCGISQQPTGLIILPPLSRSDAGIRTHVSGTLRSYAASRPSAPLARSNLTLGTRLESNQK